MKMESQPASAICVTSEATLVAVSAYPIFAQTSPVHASSIASANPEP